MPHTTALPARGAPRETARDGSVVRRSLLLLALLAAALAPALAALAAEPQAVAAVRKAVSDHLQRESAGLPGEVSFTVGALDPRLKLAACPVLETFAAPGAPPWGNTTVGVRCRAGTPWTVYVPVTVNVLAHYAVTARPLAQGQQLAPGDISMQRGDLARLPAGVVTDPQGAVGKQVMLGLAAGQPLRHDMLRAPLLIQQGQAVKVVSRGRGFQVSAEGRAITNARDGQVVQVRTQSGPVVSGVARPGPIVEVPSGG
ncbi:MAG: flagellar basal body P-ring formation protein FlgA [Burkholderiales bacterium]|nr:flagellar basal body P-ring formation protein FlgA [Burkholderiales bacterium]